MTKAISYFFGFLIALFLMWLIVGCEKENYFPSGRQHANTKVNHVGNSNFGPLIDTLQFNVYACNFDSVPNLTTIGYNTLIIKTYTYNLLTDSVSVPMGIDQSHLQLGYNLDTISNYRIANSEDSVVIKIKIISSPCDTIKYYAHGYGLVMPNNSLIHIADYHVKKVQGGYSYTKTWENPLYKPSPLNGLMSGVHIFKNINTVYLPRT